MSRKDSFGVEVEKGDIVLSCPKHKWSGKPEVGRVSGVFDSGRVTIQVPRKTSIYAHERGAPDIKYMDRQPKRDSNFRYVTEPDPTGRRDWRGNVFQVTVYEEVERTRKDYTVVGHEWTWLRKQASDITLIVLQKGGDEKKDLSEILAERVGFNDLARNVGLDYDKEKPDLA